MTTIYLYVALYVAAGCLYPRRGCHGPVLRGRKEIAPMPNLYIKYAATCRCGKRITEHALATRAECPKCGRQWRTPEVKRRDQEEARRRGRIDG